MKKFILLMVLALMFLAGCQAVPQPPGHYEDIAGSAGRAIDQSGTDKIGGWLRVGEIVAELFVPEAALLLAAVSAGYGVIKSKKLVISDAKYKSMKQGVNSFMNKNEAPDLYDEIGKARKANGVT